MKIKNYNRRYFLRIAGQTLAGIVCFPFCTVSQNNKDFPNFIFILSDDQGWNGTSVHMNPKRVDSKSDFHFTPNLEKLAKAGMRFTSGYSPAALCCPTRRSLQFGQSPTRMGYERFSTLYPRNNQKPTIPRILKSINPNYGAAHFGKWDLRTDLIPEDLGYDESDGNTGNAVGSEGSNFNNKDKWKFFAEMDDPKRIFSITGRANRFMEKQVKAKKPFYLQISHYAVHVDMQTRTQTLQKYENKEKGKLHHIPAFAGMTEDLDTGLGMVFEKIEELGIGDNTYIFYMADNGAVPWIPPSSTNNMANPLVIKEDPSRNYPLRAGKWTLYEGGIRIPFIVKGPGVKSNSSSDVPVVGWDLLPTIAALAGYQKPLPDDLDGGSWKSLLFNGGSGSVKRASEEFVFHRYAKNYPHSAIRGGDYKFVIFWQTKEKYLFDIKHDIGETNNLAEKMPAKSEELYRKLMEYLEKVDAEILQQFG